MDGPSGLDVAFPQSAGDLLDRLGSLYALDGELREARRVLELLPAVPLEASVSVGERAKSPLRLTLGLAPCPADPQGRSALVVALTGLGAGRLARVVDEALASLGAPATQGQARGLALRARRGGTVRPRPGARVGGATEADRSARIANAMRAVGLDAAATLHLRLARRFVANPFNAVVPYGLAFDLAADRVVGAKTYFCCEWADVALGLLRGPLADELELHGVDAFDRLASSAQAARRRSRWLLEVSFELPADPARGVRAKAYLPPKRLAANEVEGHRTALRLAAELGLDPQPYQDLLAVLRPDGLTTERPCSLTVGVSASAQGRSLEVYVFDPRRTGRTLVGPEPDETPLVT